MGLDFWIDNFKSFLVSEGQSEYMSCQQTKPNQIKMNGTWFSTNFNQTVSSF